jgi:hypothetical protein
MLLIAGTNSFLWVIFSLNVVYSVAAYYVHQLIGGSHKLIPVDEVVQSSFSL